MTFIIDETKFHKNCKHNIYCQSILLDHQISKTGSQLTFGQELWENCGLLFDENSNGKSLFPFFTKRISRLLRFSITDYNHKVFFQTRLCPRGGTIKINFLRYSDITKLEFFYRVTLNSNPLPQNRVLKGGQNMS